jgi:FtsZ-interacting cell division protein ZipA
VNELRSALLLVGALFIAGLFVWERRKRRDEGFPGRPSTYQEPSIEDGEHEGGSARA